MRELKQSSIASAARFEVDRFTLFLAALSVLGAASVLLREVTYGVLLNADGLTYISVARNLLVGEGFVDWQGDSYVSWAPLWPALLALVSLPGLDPHDVSGVVNAGAFALTIFVSGWWLRRRIESRSLIVWTCLSIMVPVTLVYHAATAFSETVFILFVTLSLIAMDRFLDEGRRSLLAWAAVWAALACLTRYIGVTVLFAAVIVLALDRSAGPVERVKRVLLYSSISAAPLCAWMLRNFLLTGYPMGPRGGSGAVSLLESVRLTVDGVGGWIFFPLYSERVTALAEQMGLDSLLAVIQGYAAPAVGAVLLMLTAGAAAYGLVRLRAGAAGTAAAQVRPIVVFGAFALTYLAFLTAAKSLTIVDNHARHYAPAYIPVLLMAAVGMGGLLVRYGSAGSIREMAAASKNIRAWGGVFCISIAVAAALSLWLAYHGVVNGLHARHLVTEGIGYQARPWTDSETMRYLSARSLNGHVYSQSYSITYWHLYGKHWDRSSAGILRAPRLRNLPLEKRWLGQWAEERSAAAEDTYAVWFEELRRRTDYDVQELMALPGLELVAELSDGVILRVRK